jgi:AraC family transcriptional regulator, positive regulator of tynA and feaB
MQTPYDSVLLQDKDQCAYWLELICRHFPRATGVRDNAAPFSGRLERSVLGAIEVSDIRCSSLKYERGRQDQLKDDCEDFLVSMLVEGRARIEQCGRVATQEPGDFVLYDAARPFVYEFPTNYQMMLVKIPRKTLLCRLPNAERLTAVKFSSTSPLGGLASMMVRSAVGLNLPGQSSCSAKVGSSLIDILTASFETELQDDNELVDRQAAILKRAKDYIRAHMDDSDLDVEVIARAVHVSSRTLSRAFAAEGISVIRWLWKERLSASHTALSEGRASQVADVALGCGFVSGSHFSRMFKATYGVLPHTLLRVPNTTGAPDYAMN